MNFLRDNCTKFLAIFFCALSFLQPLIAGEDDASLDLRHIPNFIFVPIISQEQSHTCGVASLRSLLQYNGDIYTEAELIKHLKPTYKNGTRYWRIKRFAEKHGYRVSVQTEMTIADLQAAIDQHRPLVVLLQAWPDEPVEDWSTMWDEGHYALAVGYDTERIYFMDPANSGKYTFIPKDEFVKRWHDIDGKERLFQFGMTIWKDPSEFNYPHIDRMK